MSGASGRGAAPFDPAALPSWVTVRLGRTFSKDRTAAPHPVRTLRAARHDLNGVFGGVLHIGYSTPTDPERVRWVGAASFRAWLKGAREVSDG